VDSLTPSIAGAGGALPTTIGVSRNVLTPRIGAWLVQLGTTISLVGLSWDIQWHVEVGPDTFFTLPHLALYSGSALSGLASLAMVLLGTVGREFGGPGMRVFGGAFTAPLGYLVSGVGAASFLGYGLLDLWWHSIYGFDAVLDTPSHVALFLSILVTMVGVLVTFAAGGEQTWARAGLTFAIPIVITFAPVPFTALDNLPMPIDPMLLGSILCAPTLLIMAGIALGRWGALRVAATLGGVQAFLWWFSSWAAAAYAAAIGLPLRDNQGASAPELPSLIPLFALVAALAIEGLLRLGRTGRITVRVLTPLLGITAGLLVAVSLPIQLDLTDPTHHFSGGELVILPVLGAVLGVPAGYLGTRFGVLLQAVAR
jgi:hypothetical protein